MRYVKSAGRVFLFMVAALVVGTWSCVYAGTNTVACSETINQDLSFSLSNAVYDDGSATGQVALGVDFQFVGEQNGQLLWQLVNVGTSSPSASCSIDLASDLSFSLTDAVYGTGSMKLQAAFKYLGEQNGSLVWYLADVSLDDGSSDPSQYSCGAYVAPGVWQEFDCYNLAAVGKTTDDDPLTPTWRLIGGYWQWGRKGPDSSQWHDTDTEHFAHGPIGPDDLQANAELVDNWNTSFAPDLSWTYGDGTSTYVKTDNDPCPDGFRVPRYSHWKGVIDNNTQTTTGTWTGSDTNYATARFFGNDLMLPAAGMRRWDNGALQERGEIGLYWGSEVSGGQATTLAFTDGDDVGVSNNDRVLGLPVRCMAE